MQPKNKSIAYTIRVEKELKDKFLRICKEMDSDSSKEIRKFMKRFIAENKKD